jgi:serine/threonine protein kinase
MSLADSQSDSAARTRKRDANARDANQRDTSELPDDPRLMAAVQEYLKQLEAGQAPNRQEFLRRYPDLMGPLAQCLDGLELVHKAAVRKKPSADGAADGAPEIGEALPANPLGDFQIIREIGRGGMGVVYEALQLSLGRSVALKVLPFAATFDSRHLDRFHREAKAAAQLHHTNIVPVYAVGVERGVHFYAMQLIEGQSLATLIHQIKRQETAKQETKGKNPASGTGASEAVGSATGPFLSGSLGAPPGAAAVETASPLSLELTTHRSTQHAKFFHTVARFMVQAADAVEHAHQFGIVHRDIKPANLLVDVHNRLWITDFGLAQFHEDAGLTQTGDIMGTLRYMSPEQASGKKVLDHRTDIYSLGATLYELVTLESIFPGRNRQELLHQIINEEPRPPRSLETTIPVELETIILKSVSKSPADRYGSAQEFAADLQRYLDDKPILAKRPSTVERVRKWSRRHPAVVGAALVILFLSVVGLLVNNWLIAGEQAKTHAALKNERARAAQARQAVDLLMDIADQELANQPFTHGIRRRILQAALVYYKEFLETQAGDEDAHAQLQAGAERARNLLAELSTLENLNLIGMATEPDVQKDLQVTDAQKADLTELDRSVFRRKRGWEHRPSTAKDRGEQLEFAKNQEAKLKTILGDDGFARLRQIELQTQGPRAFHESYAVEVLKLSPEQKQQIREFKDVAMTDARACFSETETHDSKRKIALLVDSTKLEQITRTEVKSIIGILSPQQQQQWQELIGPAFEGKLTRPNFGFGPGPKKGPPPKDDRGPKGPPPGEFGPP